MTMFSTRDTAQLERRPVEFLTSGGTKMQNCFYEQVPISLHVDSHVRVRTCRQHDTQAWQCVPTLPREIRQEEEC